MANNKIMQSEQKGTFTSLPTRTSCVHVRVNFCVHLRAHSSSLTVPEQQTGTACSLQDK